MGAVVVALAIADPAVEFCAGATDAVVAALAVALVTKVGVAPVCAVVLALAVAGPAGAVGAAA